MPEIFRFFGIVIKMFFDDHNPPHFHAFYGGHEVLIDINHLAVFAGHKDHVSASDKHTTEGKRHECIAWSD